MRSFTRVRRENLGRCANQDKRCKSHLLLLFRPSASDSSFPIAEALRYGSPKTCLIFVFMAGGEMNDERCPETDLHWAVAAVGVDAADPE